MNPSDVIRAAIDENPLEVQNTVSDLMLNKIRDAVELKKIEMAQQFFDAVPEDGWDDEDSELHSDDEDDEDDEEFEDDDGEDYDDDFEDEDFDDEIEDDYDEETGETE